MESKFCIQVHIRNHLIILIKDGWNLIIFYFIQQLRHSSKLKNFSELF